MEQKYFWSENVFPFNLLCLILTAHHLFSVVLVEKTKILNDRQEKHVVVVVVVLISSTRSCCINAFREQTWFSVAPSFRHINKTKDGIKDD